MCQIGFNLIEILLSLSKVHFKREIVSCIFYNVFPLRILKHTWKLGDLWLTYVQSTQEISDCKSGKKKNNYFLRHLPLSVGFFFFVSLSFLFFSSSCLYIFLSCFFVRLCWKRENLIIKLGPCLFCFLCLIVLFLSLFCFFLCFVCLSMLKEGKSHYSLEGRGTTWSSGGTRSWGRGCRKGEEGWSSAVGRSTYEPAVV